MATTVQPERIAPEATGVKQPPVRNLAIDAYRGFVMVLMMAEVLRLAHVAESFPGNWLWQILGYNQSHVEWSGCSLHDLIQPSFSFLVGLALPYSIASRVAKGQSRRFMTWHAVWRAILLVWLGVFLRSQHSTQTNFTFEDTLSQIGFGYVFLFLLGFHKERWQWTALSAILFGYWLAWALYPAPGPNFDYAAVGVPAAWSHNFTGFLSHWNKNSNLGQAFDVWFLNLLPRATPFRFNGGGYLTLSFIPTLGTMILGLIAGKWLRAAAPAIPWKKLLIAGVAGVAAGLFLHFTGICPVVKRIWTPAWTLFSGGACFLLLAGFCWVFGASRRKWAFPLVVVGMNSIAAYLLADGPLGPYIEHSFLIHFQTSTFSIFGAALEPLMLGIATLLTYWLILLWMYRRKIFLRI